MIITITFKIYNYIYKRHFWNSIERRRFELLINILTVLKIAILLGSVLPSKNNVFTASQVLFTVGA